MRRIADGGRGSACLQLAGWRPAQWTQDEAFLAAREAFQKGHIERLNQLADRPHRLSRSTPTSPTGSCARGWPTSLPRLQRFLAAAGRHARRRSGCAPTGSNSWAEAGLGPFEREYPAFALDDVELTCYALQARLARKDLTRSAGSARAVVPGRAQPESCAPLFDALVMPRPDHRGGRLGPHPPRAGGGQRELREVAHAPTCRPASASPRSSSISVARNPQRYLERRPLPLKTRAERELAMFATWRVAPEPAGGGGEPPGEIRQRQLPAEDRAYVWAQVATAGALKHRPEALDWFERAGERR